MRVPAPIAGWVSLGSREKPHIFVPLKRYENFSFPGMLPVVLGPHTRTQVAVRKSTSKHLSPEYTPARMKQATEQPYHLGPFIAILTTDGGTLFHGNHRNFMDLIRMGRQMGVTVFVLTPRGLRAYNDSTVHGYLLDHRTGTPRWISAKLPTPNVVYNRIPNRKAERSKEAQAAIRHLQSMPNVHLFNPSFFDKWTLYEQLIASDKLSYFVPESMKLNDAKALKKMIEKHPILYLKPIDGKAGIGMMRITKQKQGYELIYQSAKDKKKYAPSSLKSLWTLVGQLRQHLTYVVQQGIPLAKFRGRPFDVRMLFQKDGNGNWDLTGAGVRVAGVTAISTHVPMGGRIENIQVVLKEVFGDLHEQLYQRIEETGLQIAKYIESKQSSSLGEMSMDMGIERNGRIWFFEANAKPMKFDEPEIRSRSLRRIIQYSLHLSGYPQVVGGN